MIKMTIQEYMKSLDQNNSYWQILHGMLWRMNEVSPTKENFYIVFGCSCKKYHAVPYTKLKIDKHGGDYIACCPNNGNKCVEWISGHEVETSKELSGIFEKTDFEIYEAHEKRRNDE